MIVLEKVLYCLSTGLDHMACS